MAVRRNVKQAFNWCLPNLFAFPAFCQICKFGCIELQKGKIGGFQLHLVNCCTHRHERAKKSTNNFSLFQFYPLFDQCDCHRPSMHSKVYYLLKNRYKQRSSKKAATICGIIDAAAKISGIFYKSFPEKCSGFCEVRRLKSHWLLIPQEQRNIKRLEVYGTLLAPSTSRRHFRVLTSDFPVHQAC